MAMEDLNQSKFHRSYQCLQLPMLCTLCAILWIHNYKKKKKEKGIQTSKAYQQYAN